MKPTVGRIVLYTNLGDKDGRYPPEQQAAIITKVTEADVEVPTHAFSDQIEWRYEVSLTIFYPTGIFQMQNVPYSAEFERGHWTWPPTV